VSPEGICTRPLFGCFGIEAFFSVPQFPAATPIHPISYLISTTKHSATRLQCLTIRLLISFLTNFPGCIKNLIKHAWSINNTTLIPFVDSSSILTLFGQLFGTSLRGSALAHSRGLRRVSQSPVLDMPARQGVYCVLLRASIKPLV